MNIAESRHFSPLVKDYLTRFDTTPMSGFFAISPSDRGDILADLAAELTKRASSPDAKAKREQLVEALRKQQEASGNLTESVKNNLELLRQPTTLAVVTGQQAGILGGPLYTFYKTITTIGLAHELQAILAGHAVVPIFWQETEDHDFDESTHYGILDKEGNFVDVRYEVDPNIDIKRKQVASLTLDKQSLDTLWQTLSSSLQSTEFTESVLALFKKAYEPGVTLAEAQARLIGDLTKDHALLILNANTPAIKALGRHLFRKELDGSPALQNAIRLQTDALIKAGYHAQVEPSAINLFLLKDQRRYKLERSASGFKFDDEAIGAQELYRILDEEPERMSPNVAMRPLFQDTVLPTIAYVAGPGEIGYFAQFKKAYEWAGIPMPLIAPRFFATLVEDRTKKTLDKSGAGIEAMLEKDGELIAALTQTEAETTIGKAFDAKASAIEDELESLRSLVAGADPTLDGALTALKGKLLTPLKDFGAKTAAAERRKSATLRTQVERAVTSLLPGGGLQERQLGLLYFINKYGLDFTDKLARTILATRSRSEHHILEVRNIISSELPPKESR